MPSEKRSEKSSKSKSKKYLDDQDIKEGSSEIIHEKSSKKHTEKDKDIEDDRKKHSSRKNRVKEKDLDAETSKSSKLNRINDEYMISKNIKSDKREEKTVVDKPRDDRKVGRSDFTKNQESLTKSVVEDFGNYDEDFDDDFEDDISEEEVKPIVLKKKISGSSQRLSNSSRSSLNSERSARNPYDNENYDDYMRGRVMKANAHVSVPTDSVEVFASRIYFNHDSIDKQVRRANDLLNTIELDQKSFSLLDINPEDMRTVYSAHLKHEKVQTNDDVVEIEVQTDEIDFVTRWTQYPSEDLKGYGTTKDIEEMWKEDIFGKFRLDINFIGLHSFLERASRVIETILVENTVEAKNFEINHKSELEFSEGFAKFKLPKLVSKLVENATISSCVFCQEDSNYLVVVYDVEASKERAAYSIMVVWNINAVTRPFKILTCESKSTSVVYTKFIVFSGNIDGSVSLWDLREAFSLHLWNSAKKKFRTEESIIRSPTYSTAGVMLNENHTSEVKAILALQNRTGSSDTGVFQQLATLELNSQLIIWTVVELGHIDLAGFETDLGLLPGGRLKLVKSAQISLNNLITTFGKDQYQTLGLVCPIRATNNFFVNTNLGRIIHIFRDSGSSSVTTMKSIFDEANSEVTCLQFHHEVDEILLAGYGHGELRLYHVNYVLPIKSWYLSCNGNRIKDIRWIPSRSSMYIAIDEQLNLYIWNLLEDDSDPIFSMKLDKCYEMSIPWPNLVEGNSVDSLPFAMFNSDTKELEIHLFSSKWTKKSEKENKKFTRYIKNLLITF